MKEAAEKKSQIAIRVKNVSKQFFIPHERISTLKGAFVNIFRPKNYESFYALQNISFEVKKGEFFGIIGRNGSGKSTLLKILAGVYAANAGTFDVLGRISPFLELGIGFNPELSGRDNIYLNATVLGLTKKEIDEKFDSIVAFSELERFIDQKIKNYSSGMNVRLAFSVAIHANREILLMDEVLAVGDSNFQAKCLAEFNRYRTMGKTVILVTHDVGTVQRFCDRAMLLSNGQIEKIGTAEEVVNEYMYQNMSDEEKKIIKEQAKVSGAQTKEKEVIEDKKNAGTDLEKAELLKKNEILKNTIEEIYNSNSWKVTALFRKLGKVVRKEKNNNPQKIPMSKKINLINKLFKKAYVVLKRDGPFVLVRKSFQKVIHIGDILYQDNETETALSEINNDSYLANLFSKAYEKSSQSVPFLEHKYNFSENDIKLIAFYFPQYHPFPENEKFWGKGFTEWTNVTKAVPLFKDHYQPRLPGELGFYDTRLKEVLEDQIRIARNYGIYGFCFHHYWFSGKPVMRVPYDHIMANPDLDVPFCLHWANEPWTVRWDGFDKNGMLLDQNHTPADDLAFIKDIEPALKDKRYIRIDDRPLLVIYRPSLFPDIKKTIKRWNDYCESVGIGKLFLVIMQTCFEGKIDPRKYGFDAAIEYPPHNMVADDVKQEMDLFYPNFSGRILKYDAMVQSSLETKKPEYTLFRGIVPDWDCTPRRNNPDIFIGSTPEKYKDWLIKQIDYSKKNLPDNQRFIFINAWNEWAEGAYLEPDRKWGYDYLEKTYQALVARPEDFPRKIIYVGHDAAFNGAQILSLSILKELKNRFKFEIHLILKSGGVLEEEYQKYATVYNLAKFYKTKEQKKSLIRKLKIQGARTAITSTILTGDVAELLKEEGIKILSLVHELTGVVKKNNAEALAKIIAQKSDYVVFPSDFVSDRFSAIVPIDKTKVHIRPQGLPRTNIYSNNIESARNLLRKNLGLKEDSIIILSVAYAEHRKGIDLFLDVVSKISDSRICFVWVGDIAPEMSAIVDAKIKICRNVKLIKTMPEISLFYAGADIYLMTSREEPFGSVVIESMNVGVPVIGFQDAGGFADIVTEKTGILVPYLDTSRMVKSILHLAENEELRRKLGTASKKLISENFIFKDYIYYLLNTLGLEYKKVSVIVPNYNHAKYLSRRLDSILSQSYPLYEFIILDDASTDKSVKTIDDFIHKKQNQDIQKIINIKNSGSVFHQWEKGIQISRGDFLWIAESDDYCQADFLYKVMQGFNEEKVVLSYCQSYQVDEKGEIICPNYLGWTNDIDQTKWLKDHTNSGQDEITKILAIKNTIPNVSATVFQRINFSPFIEKLSSYSLVGDWFFYLHLLSIGDIHFVAEPLNFHRRHKKSVTGTTKDKMHLAEIIAVQNFVQEKYHLLESTMTKMLEYREKAKKRLGL